MAFVPLPVLSPPRRTHRCGICYCGEEGLFREGIVYCNRCPRWVPAEPGPLPIDGAELARLREASAALEEHVGELRRRLMMGEGWLEAACW